MACQDARVDVLALLIAKGGNLKESATKAQWSPLLFATCLEEIANASQHFGTVKVLFNHGVNIQETAANGWTALHGAVRMRHDGLVRYLIE